MLNRLSSILQIRWEHERFEYVDGCCSLSISQWICRSFSWKPSRPSPPWQVWSSSLPIWWMRLWSTVCIRDSIKLWSLAMRYDISNAAIEYSSAHLINSRIRILWQKRHCPNAVVRFFIHRPALRTCNACAQLIDKSAFAAVLRQAEVMLTCWLEPADWLMTYSLK